MAVAAAVADAAAAAAAAWARPPAHSHAHIHTCERCSSGIGGSQRFLQRVSLTFFVLSFQLQRNSFVLFYTRCLTILNFRETVSVNYKYFLIFKTYLHF